MTARASSLTSRNFWNFPLRLLVGIFLSELTRVVKGSKPDVADFSRRIFNQPQERHINKDQVQQTNPNPNQTTQNVQ